MRTNKRVGALVKKDNKVLMIHRFKDGSEYWVLPGGGVEDDEDIEQALVREVLEETSCRLVSSNFLGNWVDDNNTEHHLFDVQIEGELSLGGPEKDNMSDNNIYILEWVNQEVLLKIEAVYPKDIKNYL